MSVSMDGREQRAHAALVDVVDVRDLAPDMFEVVTVRDVYRVDVDLGACECPDYEYNLDGEGRCKHIHAARVEAGETPVPTAEQLQPVATDGGERSAADRFPLADGTFAEDDRLWVSGKAVHDRDSGLHSETASQGVTVQADLGDRLRVEYPRHGDTETATIAKAHVRETDLEAGERVTISYDSVYTDGRVEKTGTVASVHRTRGDMFDGIYADVDGTRYQISSTGQIKTYGPVERSGGDSVCRRIGDDAVVERETADADTPDDNNGETVLADGGGQWVVRDPERGNERGFDSRADAESAIDELADLDVDAELIPPGQTDGGQEQPPVVEDTTAATDAEAVEPASEPGPEHIDNGASLPERSVADDPLNWVPGEFIDEIDGSPAINRKGFEVLSHFYDVDVHAELQVPPEETDHEYCRVKATATMPDGRECEAFGSAHVDRDDDPWLLLEMADTRARKRALSIATGVGAVAVAELKNEVGQ